MENREPLMAELEELNRNITSLYQAIKDRDRQALTDLLEQGHQVKTMLGE